MRSFFFLFISLTMLLSPSMGTSFLPRPSIRETNIEETLGVDPSSLPLSSLPFPTQISILIDKKCEEVIIAAKGGCTIYTPPLLGNPRKVLCKEYKERKTLLSFNKKGLVWRKKPLKASSIIIEPRKPEEGILLNGIQYQGSLLILLEGHSFQIINVLDIENYIESVYSHLFAPLTKNHNVLNALAIIARTNTQYICAAPRKNPWNIEAEKVGYRGYGATLINSNIERSIQETAHIIMTYGEHPFPARWTPHSGGHTASYSAIYRKAISSPPGANMEAAYRARNASKWRYALPKKDLAYRLRMNKITEIDLFVDPISQKTYGLRIKDGSHTLDKNFFKFQKLLGKEKLMSNTLKVSIEKDMIVFSGYGKGDGVGLCLYEAEGMANLGKTTKEILMTAFPKTMLIRTKDQ